MNVHGRVEILTETFSLSEFLGSTWGGTHRIHTDRCIRQHGSGIGYVNSVTKLLYQPSNNLYLPSKDGSVT